MIKIFQGATIAISILTIFDVALAEDSTIPSISEDQIMSANSHTQTGLIQYCVAQGFAQESAVDADRKRALASDQRFGYGVDMEDIPKFEAIGAQGLNFTLAGKIVALDDHIAAGNTWETVQNWCFENTNR